MFGIKKYKLRNNDEYLKQFYFFFPIFHYFLFLPLYFLFFRSLFPPTVLRFDFRTALYSQKKQNAGLNKKLTALGELI